ncbi:MAG TPA: hypothetical protein VFN61_03740 [Acidimicrobiales bacterium]|nr:hypothetical protein [Acidimicrobiales bacterium]
MNTKPMADIGKRHACGVEFSRCLNLIRCQRLASHLDTGAFEALRDDRPMDAKL